MGAILDPSIDLNMALRGPKSLKMVPLAYFWLKCCDFEIGTNLVKLDSFGKHYCKKAMFSERVKISKSQFSTQNKRFLKKVKLFCTIASPNLANFDAKFGQF